jgi:hypothetical protein
MATIFDTAKVCPTCGKELRCNQGGFKGHLKACGTNRGADLFWAKVEKTDRCWLYRGFIKWDGYGWVRRGPKNMAAHRYAWILTHGEPPEGMHLLHTCDTPACVNPTHLRLGTHAENMADMAAKGRSNTRNMDRPLLWPDRIRPRRAA